MDKITVVLLKYNISVKKVEKRQKKERREKRKRRRERKKKRQRKQYFIEAVTRSVLVINVASV